MPWRKIWQTHSSILAWKSPWTEEPGELQSMGSQKSSPATTGLNNNRGCVGLLKKRRVEVTIQNVLLFNSTKNFPLLKVTQVRDIPFLPLDIVISERHLELWLPSGDHKEPLLQKTEDDKKPVLYIHWLPCL